MMNKPVSSTNVPSFISKEDIVAQALLTEENLPALVYDLQASNLNILHCKQIIELLQSQQPSSALAETIAHLHKTLERLEQCERMLASVVHLSPIPMQVVNYETISLEHLVEALAEDRFQLHVQTIIPLKISHGLSLCGEVLVRMQDANEKILSPAYFLPVAERYRLMPEIDKVVFRKVCTWLAQHPIEGAVAVNLSAQSLMHKHFADFLINTLQEYGIAGNKICLELTETVAISNLALAQEFIYKLKAVGCSFALDDFGSGVSSLAYLRSLPVDFVKIDGVFIKDMEDPIYLALIRSIQEFCQLSGKQTVAECVEDRALLEKLRDIGIDFAQGYGIARPCPLKQWEG
jgi:EAL domain-containing protein (putative c-di-GMP-specific phosphodiesterase class I)